MPAASVITKARLSPPKVSPRAASRGRAAGRGVILIRADVSPTGISQGGYSTNIVVDQPPDL